MSDWMELHRAVVFPWHCDHLGHMNVRWYAHFFDDASFHLWTRVGIRHSEIRERGIVTVVARTATDFLHELRAGQLLVVTGAFTRLGEKSFTYRLKMENAEDGTLCAVQEAVEVCFDLETRASSPMPDDFRARLEKLVIAED